MTDRPYRHIAKGSPGKSEERLNLILEAGEYGIWELDTKTGSIWKSPRHDLIFGYTKPLPRWTYRMLLDHVIPDDRNEAEENFRTALSARAVIDFECRIKDADGNVRWIWIQGKPRLDARGQVTHVTGIVKDITERKRMEDALKKSEALLRQTQEISMTGGWEMDMATGKTTWTDETYRIYGVSKDYDADDIDSNISFYAPEHRPVIRQALERAVEKGDPYDLELKFTNARGEERWVRTIARPVLRDGRVEKITGNLMDVTERKQTELKLLESRQLIQGLIESTTAVVYFKDTEGRITFLNSRAQQSSQIPIEEILGLKVSDIWPPEISCPMEANDRQVLASGQPLETEEIIRLPDGDHWFLTSKFPIRDAAENIIGIGGMSTDITDRKHAEHKLRESEERFRIMADSSPLIIWMMDPSGGIVFINRTFREFFGVSLKDVSGLNWLPLVHPDDADAYIGVFKTAVEGKKPFYAQARLRSSSGSWRWVESFGAPWFSPEGEFLGYVGNSIDITERIQAEEDLNRYRRHLEDLVRERTSKLEASSAKLKGEIAERKRIEKAIRSSEEQYRMLVENANEGIIIAQNGRFQFVNPKFAEMLGYSQEELISRPFVDFIHPDDRQMVTERHRRRMGGESEPILYPFRVLSRKGETRWIEINAVKISWKGKPATLNFLTDITERVRMEEDKKSMEAQFAQTQKIEALGTFAGGIAHDLNNILYPIIINIEMLLSDSEKGSDQHEALSQILSAAYRQRDLVKQILAFSRKSEGKLSPVRIVPLLNETLSLLRASLPSTIQVQSHIDEGSYTVLGDPTQIQQIIMNLFRNAADSLEAHKGVIEVNLTNARIEPVRAHQDLKPGEYLKLTIQDSGRGITADIMDRIFEPFFTTKEVGKGLGMGLPVAHGIAKKLGGVIAVESVPGKGSIFTVFLPVLAEQPGELGPADDQRLACGEASPILLVDDEKIILSSMQRALERSGYAVVSVQSGREALDIFAENPQRFCLVITDLSMPGVDGRELVKRLIDIRPDIPVILSTGYGDSITEQEAKSLGIREMLMKPPNTHELKAAIHRVLQG